MKTLAPFILLLVAACGGRSVMVEPVNDSGTRSNAGDGGEAVSDGGSLLYDAAGETRSDCSFVIGQAACESRAEAYCNAFVPCLLASGKIAAKNGEHYDVDQCLAVLTSFCDVPEWRVAICSSNLSVCVNDLRQTDCGVFMQKAITLPTSCDIYGGDNDGLAGKVVPPSPN